jgi:predicted nucleic acid-binding protein
MTAIRKAATRGEMSWRLAGIARDRFLGSTIDPRSPPNLYQESWRVAEALGWVKTYDAEYVALARILGSPLLTADLRLRTRVASLVEVVLPADL